MRITFTFFSVLLFFSANFQTKIKSMEFGNMIFRELEFGIARVAGESTGQLSASPTGTRHWLEDFDSTSILKMNVY